MAHVFPSTEKAAGRAYAAPLARALDIAANARRVATAVGQVAKKYDVGERKQ